MAIQNFLSGGYYGKLGATVGQRWKNKRTIRTYVVPANPRTEVQQANRSKFASAVTYAQMGMQMNYYATCFSDPNFTHWNYRMKVARELRNAGLTGLDLIPLYPQDFTPPTIISEITKDTVTGRKHISFATPSLTGNTDRVLSLMFALYDTNDQYLGLKLYLGYYYASNPGYIEVDVDDIDEINSHCFVRIVSNDDEDSATDLIGSPTLQVQAQSIDIRDFNTDIVSFSKDASGITVTFAELWKGATTTNTITATVHFISNGANESAYVSAAALIENNGYCAVFIPYVTSDNQHLPAFPSGSDIMISSVEYDGATWQYTKTDDTKSLVDTDLTREINASPSWSASSTGDITFTIPFGGTVASGSQSMQMVCSGRLDDRSAVAQSFSYEGDGFNLTFICVGDLKNYPMSTSGDKITIPTMQFVCNGVTYNLASQDVNLRNAITTSYWLRSDRLTKYFRRDGGGSVGDGLISLYMQVSGVTMDTDPTYNSQWISEVITVNNHYLTPSYCDMDRDASDPSEILLFITAYFEGQDYYEEVNTSCRITPASLGTRFTYKGIVYIFPIFPETIGGWEV